jgi:hypothetical protein
MNQRNGTTPLQAGELNFNGPRQIYKPKPIILATSSGSAEASISTRIRIPAPDSRCRIKVSVIFFPLAGLPVPDLTLNIGTIWVAAYEEDTDGISGGAGRTVPVTDVEGTSAAPTAFPKSVGLAGYSREFVTAADWLEAVITLNSMDTQGAWVLQTRIQPDAVTFTWPEWDAIRRLFDPQNAGGQGKL